VRYFSDEISKIERSRIEKWMESDPANQKTIDSLRIVWELSQKDTSVWDVDMAWMKFAQQANIRIPNKSISSFHPSYPPDRVNHFLQRFQSLRGRFVVWGTVALCVLVSALFWSRIGNSLHQQSATRKISTEKGQQTRIELTDGTRIRLNAASAISFPERSTQGLRECTLHGEAYFEVAHNDRMPFIVHTDGATIEVLGTEFNVQAWPEDKQINVVVADGRVLFRSTQVSDLQQVLLTKGQMSHLSEKGIISPPVNVDISKQLAWINGGLAFENTRLQDVLRSLERRYNITFSISDSSLLTHRLTSNFTKDQPINKILNIIAISVDVKYKHMKDTVVLYSHSGTK
jgi:transmembrane sensor